MGLLELVFFSCSKNTMYNFSVPILSSFWIKTNYCVIHFGVFWIQATRCRSTPSIKSLKTAQVRVRNMREMCCCPNVLNYTTPLKGNHLKMKIVSLISYPHVVPNSWKLCSFSEHNLRYFGWKPGDLWLSHWLHSKLQCQGQHHQNNPSAISDSIWN